VLAVVMPGPFLLGMCVTGPRLEPMCLLAQRWWCASLCSLCNTVHPLGCHVLLDSVSAMA
jgi:hypothetical protein